MAIKSVGIRASSGMTFVRPDRLVIVQMREKNLLSACLLDAIGDALLEGG